MIYPARSLPPRSVARARTHEEGARFATGVQAGRCLSVWVLVVGLLALTASLPTLAQSAGPDVTTRVALGGSLGQKALLIINGVPRTLATGETVDGVRLLSVRSDQAEVQVEGQRLALRIGAAPVNLSGTPTPGIGRRILLTADSGGHFWSDGTINGRTARFMVDTGATMVSMSQNDAERIGLNFRDAPRGMVRTANGDVPAHRVILDSIRVGDVLVRSVEAVVIPTAMDHVLLGNSFLSRFQLVRENDRLTLDRKP
jgi:aspartyl protease family protein